MIAKAPTLAWLLAALTCFLVGTFVGEAPGGTVPSVVVPTPAAAVAIAVAPTGTPSPRTTFTPLPTLTPPPEPPPAPPSRQDPSQQPDGIGPLPA